MLIRIIAPVMIRGKGYEPGTPKKPTLVEVTETEAQNIVSVGRGELVDARDPQPENRDPQGQ